MDAQNYDPELVLLLGESIGNACASALPFNVQYLTGNVLFLLGHAFETFRA